MKRLSTILCFLMLARVALGINASNYPIRITAHSDDMFWIGNVNERTNYNFPYANLKAQLQNELTFLGTNNVPVNLPIVFLKPDGSYSYKGVAYTTTNSPTAGIQEAISTLLGTVSGGPERSDGGMIFFAPGTYYTTANIYTPWGTNICTLDLQGSGQTSTRICYIGSSSNEVISVAATNPVQSVMSFSLKDMWICSVLNTNTSLVHLKGGYSSFAPIGPAQIQNVVFRNGTNIDLFSTEHPNNQRNLIGLDVDLNYNSPCKVYDCTFYDLGCGVSWACDWGNLQNNQFLFGGGAQGVTNIWPVASPYSIGTSVLFTESRSGSILNGNKSWYICNNSFVGCAPQYVSILRTNGFGNASFVNRVTIWQDSRENQWSGEALAATANCTVSFVNGHSYDLNGHGGSSFSTYFITNTTDYSTWNTVPCPTNVIKFTSFE